VVYDNKEPLELPVVDSELRRELVKAFGHQAKRPHLSLDMQTEVPKSYLKCIPLYLLVFAIFCSFFRSYYLKT
jgi:hypothetical protein